MVIRDLEEFVDFVKPQVRDYLTEHTEIEMDALGKIRCLNPEHSDRTPSMNVAPDGCGVYCHSCQAKYDIFDIHNFVTGRGEGDGFVNDCKSLALKMGIDLQTRPVTPAELKKIRTKFSYSVVAAAVADPVVDREVYKTVKSFAKERGWTVETLQELGVGCISLETIPKLKGIVPADLDAADKESWIEDIDLGRGGLFGGGKIVFTYRDLQGNAVGFATRNVTWNDESKFPKWNNTRGSTSGIFHKKNLLYNLALAKRKLSPESPNLYIFEGQGDVVTAWQAGLQTVVACGRNGLSPKQIQLVKRSHASRAILCLDGDEGGAKGTMSLVESSLSDFGGTKLLIKTLPKGEDVDSYIRKFGLDAFRAIAEQDAYDWMIAAYGETYEAEALASKMVPIIAGFTNAIEREGLCRRLSKVTEFSVTSLLDEVNKIVNAVEMGVRMKKNEIAEDLLHKIRVNPDNATSLLSSAKDEMEMLEDTSSKSFLSGDYCSGILLGFREEFERQEDSFPGYNMTLMPQYAGAFANDWRTGKMLLYGGYENCGKTSMVTFLNYNLICPESENNVRAFHMSIDDSIKEILPKYICIAAKHLTMGWKQYANGFDLQLNHVIRPKYWYQILEQFRKGLGDDMMYAYKVGYARVSELIKSEHLTFAGIPEVRSAQDFLKCIRQTRAKHPDDNLIGLLDNLHKLTLPNGDARMAFKEISNDIKAGSEEHQASFILTAEYNSSKDNTRNGGRPTNNSLAETRALKYDANAITHMFNALHTQAEESPFYHYYQYPWSTSPVKLPRVEAIIGKNKIDSDKEAHFFNFLPGSSWFQYVDRSTAITEAKNISENGDAQVGTPSGWSVDAEQSA